MFLEKGGDDRFAQYFTGNSFLNPLTGIGKTPVFLANVTFEPGCHNNWHIHHAAKGGRADPDLYGRRRLVPGRGKSACQSDAGNCDYHSGRGKALAWGQKDSWFSHISVEVPGEKTSNEWCEPVTEREYQELD